MQRMHSFEYCTATTTDSSIRPYFKKWLHAYEDFVGLTGVKLAQKSVIQAEANFVAIQRQRREKQHALSAIQVRLKKLNSELEKIPRSDDRYLALLTEEHTIIKDDQVLSNILGRLEVEERDQFTLLSTALRNSHEKESAQAERTKYWSIGGSLLGAFIGIIGTTVNNRLRMRELKSMILSRDTTPIITEKLQSIESGLDKVHGKLKVGSDNAVSDRNSVNTELQVVQRADSSSEVLQRIDNFEQEVVKTAVCSLVTLIILVICYSFS